MRRQQTGLTLVLEPITLSVDVENVAVVWHQCRRRYHRVSQQFLPVGEAFVLRQYDAATLVPRGYQAASCRTVRCRVQLRSTLPVWP